MKVAVAGGTGFLGRYVTAALRAAGHEVLLLARGTRAVADADGVEIARCDVAAGDLPLERLGGCQTIVNLIGIKREEGRQTFERAHVEATRLLLDAARRLGIRRFVHISVVCSRPDPNSLYHDTKWRAEELVRASGLDCTILKPGVIYGRGDDMITHLVKMIRFAPLFPVVGKGDSILQPVRAEDVAAAVAAALARDVAIGKAYDLVGPDRLTLREVVRTVAEGTGLPLWIVSAPVWFQRLAVRLMTALFRSPLSTPAQLQMLIDGLYGDPEPARRELGVEPAPFTPGAVRELERPITPLFGFSLRLVDRREQAAWLRACGVESNRSLAIMVLAIALLVGLALTVENVWIRMALYYLVLLPVALLGLKLPWRDLLRPTGGRLAAGVAAAALLYLLGWAGFRTLMALFPDLAPQAEALYAWQRSLPPWLARLLLAMVIVPGEELVWRGAVTLPLAGRIGDWPGCLLGALAFSTAHLAFNSPLLLAAALGAGLFWSALTVKTRNLVPALVCHLLWDVTLLYWLPY